MENELDEKESTPITSLQGDIAVAQKGKQNEKKKNLGKLYYFLIPKQL